LSRYFWSLAVYQFVLSKKKADGCGENKRWESRLHHGLGTHYLISSATCSSTEKGLAIERMKGQGKKFALSGYNSLILDSILSTPDKEGLITIA